jgi:hypothetical protein
MGTGCAARDPVARAASETDGQFPKPDELGYREVQRHRCSMCMPVVVGFAVHAIGPCLWRRVEQERLQEEIAERPMVAVVLYAGDGPYLIGQETIREPAALFEHDEGRPQPPLLGTEQIVGSRR